MFHTAFEYADAVFPARWTASVRTLVYLSVYSRVYFSAFCNGDEDRVGLPADVQVFEQNVWFSDYLRVSGLGSLPYNVMSGPSD